MTHDEFTRCVAERIEIVPIEKSKDQDRGKGAVEQDQENEGGNTSMSGQLGHRDENAELKNADSDLSRRDKSIFCAKSARCRVYPTRDRGHGAVEIVVSHSS